MVREFCQRSQVELKAIDHFIFTQVNKKVIEEVMAILQQPMEKTTCVMDRYGDIGLACIPIAFKEAVDRGGFCRCRQFAYFLRVFSGQPWSSFFWFWRSMGPPLMQERIANTYSRGSERGMLHSQPGINL